MSDRIAVLNGGCVEQYAAPETSWHDPASEFVACFVGKPNWLSETEMFRPETAAQTPAKGALHFELPVQSVQYPGSPAIPNFISNSSPLFSKKKSAVFRVKSAFLELFFKH